MKRKWIRPRESACPKCGKPPTIRVDRQVAELLGYMVTEHDVAGDFLSTKCIQCRTTFPVRIEQVCV